MKEINQSKQNNTCGKYDWENCGILAGYGPLFCIIPVADLVNTGILVLASKQEIIIKKRNKIYNTRMINSKSVTKVILNIPGIY